MKNYVSFLSEVNLDNISETGGKAAHLGKLLQAGFPVPSGFCIKISAFDAFFDATNLNGPVNEIASTIDYSSIREVETKSAEIRELITAAEIPGEITDVISKSYMQLENDNNFPLVAVRSSVGTRDLSHSSFPGQMDTYHNVLGADEVLRLVRECWASSWTARAASIMNALGIDYKMLIIAPLVQVMVPSETAGVLFTANPANGRDDEMMINAGYGLGEAVVSGNITPDEYIVSKKTLDILSENIGNKSFKLVLDIKEGKGNQKIDLPAEDASKACLTRFQVNELSKMGMEIEKHYSINQDIEWAYAGGKLHLLQSRKITGLERIRKARSSEELISEFDTKIKDPPHRFTSRNIGEVLPEVVTPSSLSIAKILDYGFWKINYDLGLVKMKFPKGEFDYVFLGIFYGKAFLNLTEFKNITDKIPGGSLEEIERPVYVDGECDIETTPFAVKLLPGLLRTIFGIIRLRLRIFKALDQAVKLCRERIADNRKLDFTKIEPSEFADILERNTRESMDIMALHIANSQLAVASYDILRKLTRKWFDDATGSFASRLVTGLSTLESAKPSFEIYRLYKFISKSPELKALILTTDSTKIMDILKGGSGVIHELKVMMESFLGQYGYRGISEGEMINPSWEQEPSFVFLIIKNYLQADYVDDPEEIETHQREDRIAAEKNAWSRINSFKRMVFNKVLSDARKFISARETNKALVIKEINENKKIYNELNKRFLKKEFFKEKDDIYFITLPELLVLCRGEQPDFSARIKRRREEYLRNQDVILPEFFTGRPEPVNNVSCEIPLSSILVGLPVSPGCVTGPARVILNLKKDAHIESGEILVAPVTDASWTPLFLMAKAIVVDVGGLLSHGSVVAREFGIPGVLNVIVGTKVIKTGQMITVDGAKGEVYIHKGDVL
ncbi:MAG: hypothetical protein HF978_17340 [Desulfobacteraceae bacterium]|nr:hypothetical protein [Desulfobacteraceae bacterium]MBC2757310.1 hypothetical protein [Desulfobacteraceae bacterium]